MIEAVLMMLGTGLVLGAVLGIAAKVFYIKVDARLESVTNMLPGYNCGGCGYSGCASFAEALCTRKTDDINLCRPSKIQARQEICDYLANTPDLDGNTLSLKNPQ